MIANKIRVTAHCIGPLPTEVTGYIDRNDPEPESVHHTVLHRLTEFYNSFTNIDTVANSESLFWFPLEDSETEQSFLCIGKLQTADSKRKAANRLLLAAIITSNDIVENRLSPGKIFNSCDWQAEIFQTGSFDLELKPTREYIPTESLQFHLHHGLASPKKMIGAPGVDTLEILSGIDYCLREKDRKFYQESVVIYAADDWNPPFPFTFVVHQPENIVKTPHQSSRDLQVSGRASDNVHLAFLAQRLASDSEISEPWKNRLWGKCQDLIELDEYCDHLIETKQLISPVLFAQMQIAYQLLITCMDNAKCTQYKTFVNAWWMRKHCRSQVDRPMTSGLTPTVSDNTTYNQNISGNAWQIQSDPVFPAILLALVLFTVAIACWALYSSEIYRI